MFVHERAQIAADLGESADVAGVRWFRIRARPLPALTGLGRLIAVQVTLA